MSEYKKVQIKFFLKEHPERFNPEQANKLGLKRLQKIDFSGNMHFLDDKKTNTNMILIKSGDLVISGINVEKGAVAVYQNDEDILATIHYSSYKFDKNKIDINYFKWFLKSDAFRKVVLSQTRGGIKTELKPKHFLPLEIPLPSLEKQKQILKKIDSIKNEIEQLENNVLRDKTLLKSLRQSILSEAVQGKLVPQNPNDEPASELLKKIKSEKEKLIKEGKIKKGKELPPISDDEIPYELPSGWVWCRLGEVCEKMGSGSTPRGGKSVYKKEGVIFIRSQNVYNQGLNLSNVVFIDKDIHEKMSGTKILLNDLLLNITGGSIGRCALVLNNFKEANVSQHVTIIRLISGLDNKYFHNIILSPYFQDYIMAVQNGANREGLAKKNMELMLIPLPPLSEQKRIVEKVDVLMKFCDELGLKIKENKENSERLMGAVLREVFKN